MSSTTTGDAPMTEQDGGTPFVFVSTHRLRPGVRDAFERYIAGFVRTIEEQEPQIALFSIYLDEDAEHVGVLHVHPDAASMAHHMTVAHEHITDSYETYLDGTESIQVFGEPTDDVLGAMRALAGTGVPVSINRPIDGFDRLTRVPTPS